jgi:hypothetical protein
LAALMVRDGLNPTQLAKEIKRPTLQSQIHRLVHGEVGSPSAGTAAPLAAYFGLPLEAMYDEKVATALARERGVTELPPEMTPTKKKRSKVAAPALDEDAMQVAAQYAELGPEERQRFRALLSPPDEEVHPSVDLSVRIARLLTLISTTPADQRLQAVISAELAVRHMHSGVADAMHSPGEEPKSKPSQGHRPDEGTQPT